jgi:hypothetical protein
MALAFIETESGIIRLFSRLSLLFFTTSSSQAIAWEFELSRYSIFFRIRLLISAVPIFFPAPKLWLPMVATIALPGRLPTVLRHPCGPRK